MKKSQSRGCQQAKHQHAVQRVQRKARRRRMPAAPEMSPEARFGRSRVGPRGELQQSRHYAWILAYGGAFTRALAHLEGLNIEKLSYGATCTARVGIFHVFV
jgi:hypothetical protein